MGKTGRKQQLRPQRSSGGHFWLYEQPKSRPYGRNTPFLLSVKNPLYNSIINCFYPIFLLSLLVFFGKLKIEFVAPFPQRTVEVRRHFNITVRKSTQENPPSPHSNRSFIFYKLIGNRKFDVSAFQRYHTTYFNRLGSHRHIEFATTRS